MSSSTQTEPGRSALDGLARREADHLATLAAIGKWNLIRLNARDYVHDDKNGMIMFRVGRSHKMIVVLRADDTYAVEIGKFRRINGLQEFCSIATIGDGDGFVGLYADQLGEQIDALYAQVIA
jgi:hypothetical protein